jgi:hypothetical protein
LSTFVAVLAAGVVGSPPAPTLARDTTRMSTLCAPASLKSSAGRSDCAKQLVSGLRCDALTGRAAVRTQVTSQLLKSGVDWTHADWTAARAAKLAETRKCTPSTVRNSDKLSWPGSPESAGLVDRAKARCSSRMSVDWARSTPHITLRQLANLSILLVGGSTIRMMATDLMMHTRTAQMAAFTPKLTSQLVCPGNWSIDVHPCNASRGYGCSSCVCCCGRNCSRRRVEPASSNSSHQASAEGWHQLFVGWSDFTATCSSYSLRIDFSWKPEMHTVDDDAAFHSRFCSIIPCRHVYDVVLIGKGLHDAVFRPAPLDEFRSTMQRKTHALGTLLRCLPQTTLIVARTPYATSQTRNRSLYNEDPGLLNVAANAVRDAVARRRFGHRPVLIDAFEMTSDPRTPAPYDGTHYPPPVQLHVWDLVLSQLVQRAKAPKSAPTLR